jgi:hypothetical protein
MNGCHSTLHPDNRQHETVSHSKGNVKWPYVFTKDCQYIKQKNINDPGCDGCKEKEKKC